MGHFLVVSTNKRIDHSIDVCPSRFFRVEISDLYLDRVNAYPAMCNQTVMPRVSGLKPWFRVTMFYRLLFLSVLEIAI